MSSYVAWLASSMQAASTAGKKISRLAPACNSHSPTDEAPTMTSFASILRFMLNHVHKPQPWPRALPATIVRSAAAGQCGGVMCFTTWCQHQSTHLCTMHSHTTTSHPNPPTDTDEPTSARTEKAMPGRALLVQHCLLAKLDCAVVATLNFYAELLFEI
jgi:hypothetical protein